MACFAHLPSCHPAIHHSSLTTHPARPSQSSQVNPAITPARTDPPGPHLVNPSINTVIFLSHIAAGVKRSEERSINRLTTRALETWTYLPSLRPLLAHRRVEQSRAAVDRVHPDRVGVDYYKDARPLMNGSSRLSSSLSFFSSLSSTLPPDRHRKSVLSLPPRGSPLVPLVVFDY